MREAARSIRLLLTCLSIPTGSVAALSPALAQPATEAADSKGTYRVGPGDILRIAAFRSPELSLDVQVSETGKISYPLLGELNVAGHTPFEVGRLIEQRLKRGNYFTQPQINVLVADYRSKLVSVTGQVAKPGRYPIDTGTLRLSELLAQAGGVLPAGSDEVTVLRGDGSDMRRIRVNLASLFSGESAEDLIIHPGDRVFIDKAPRMYVRGEVQRPGEFPITAGLTVGQALALAGGVTPRGNERNVDVYRLAPDGRRKAVEVARSDLVQPNDEIVVHQRVF